MNMDGLIHLCEDPDVPWLVMCGAKIDWTETEILTPDVVGDMKDERLCPECVQAYMLKDAS